MYTAGEVEKVLSAMKKVIERLQRENDSLQKNSKKHQQMKDTEIENQRLKVISTLLSNQIFNICLPEWGEK